jgi:hypothetical protein
MLARVWASDGTYSDPTPTFAAGRAALSDSIDAFQRMQGMDFGEFAADGRIRRIVGFFGPPPAVSR